MLQRCDFFVLAMFTHSLLSLLPHCKDILFSLFFFTARTFSFVKNHTKFSILGSKFEVYKVRVMFYGAVLWDPWLILAQIVCLQCLYYTSLGFFLSILVGTRVSRLSLVYFFDLATVTISTVTGWCVIASFILASVAGAGFMLYLVERAKKCLDFAATVHIIHLFICIVYGGWPSAITWWVANGTGFAVMALLGEYLCIRRELKEIPITRYRSSV